MLCLSQRGGGESCLLDFFSILFFHKSKTFQYRLNDVAAAADVAKFLSSFPRFDNLLSRAEVPAMCSAPSRLQGQRLSLSLLNTALLHINNRVSAKLSAVVNLYWCSGISKYFTSVNKVLNSGIGA